MAKRRLKKSVKATLLGLGIIFVGGFIVNNFDGETDHADASYEEPAKHSDSYVDKASKNSEMALEFEDLEGEKAFYLGTNDNYSTFMINETGKKIYVSSQVLLDSSADYIQTGDSVVLYYNERDLVVKFVEAVGGKSVQVRALTLQDYDYDYTYIEYVDESGYSYDFDRSFILENNLDNNVNVGSLATAYVYDEKIVAINTGW